MPHDAWMQHLAVRRRDDSAVARSAECAGPPSVVRARRSPRLGVLRAVQFYAALCRAALLAQAEYRVGFAIAIVTTIMLQISALSFYWVVFHRASTVGNWTSAGVLFLFGLTGSITACSEVAFNGIWQLPFRLMRGQMDRLLVYPVRTLPFLLMAGPEAHALGNLASGLALLGLALTQLDPSPITYLLLPIWIASGTIIYTSFLVVLGSLNFLVRGPDNAQYFVALHLLNATRYPLHIYPRWLQALLTFLFPIGLATYLPGKFVTGESGLAAIVTPPAAALISSAVAVACWNFCIRRYQSVGS